MMRENYDIIVVGSGVTGMTAAKLAAQRGLRTACIESLLFGGLIVNINEIDGVDAGEPTSGVSLATALMADVVGLGVANFNETVTDIHCRESSFLVRTGDGEHAGRAVIVASGAQLRRLDIPGEMEFEHKGVSHCADCDGPMYRGRDVVVVGGGDSALQEALVLAGFCRRVHVLLRSGSFRARQHFVSAIAAKDNISVVRNTIVEEVLGTERVERVRGRNTADGHAFEVPCAALFPFIGLQPNTAFVPARVQRGENGSLKTDSQLQTSVSGLFAAGAVRSDYGGRLSDAVSDAAVAVTSAAAWVARH